MPRPAPALADTPLPTPTNLAAQHVSDTAADLSWLGSGLSAGDVVQCNVNGAWQTYATGTSAGTIAPTSWNATIAPGRGAFPGFSGSAGPPPSGFTLNGVPC